MNNNNKTFKHSGALGDLLYSLPIVKHFGGGDFYLHLNQMNWIGQHYYGSPPAPFHQGRMTPQDFEYMRTFMEAQEYIREFKVMESNTEITHNLDRFRPAFVGHPGNYVDIYATTFGITDTLYTTPWLTVPTPYIIPDRPVIISRSQRWIPPTPGEQWAAWKEQGMEEHAVFIGLPEEHQAFCQSTGLTIPHHPTNTMLEVAQVIAGGTQFIGNQSSNLAIAIGLGVKTICCEARQDLPMAKNECYFPECTNIHYF